MDGGPTNAQNADNMKVSFRAGRRSPSGPGWYDINATGPGGDLFLEWALKELYSWCTMLEAVELPELSSDFPAQAVKDVLGNLKECVFCPRATHVDARQLTVNVSGHSPGLLRSKGRRRKRRAPAAGVTAGSSSSSRQPPASPQSLASVSEMPARPRPPPPPDPEAVKRVMFLALAPPPPAAADDLEEDAPPPPTSIAPAAASKGSGASASASQAPFAGVTASGLQVKKVHFRNTIFKLDIEKLIPPEVTVVRDDASMPPYYDRSLAEMETLRKQQKLTVSLGVERVKFTGLPELVDSDVKIAFCTTALRRPTVAMALTINLALTWKRRQNITWFVVDFNEDKELTNSVIEALEPAIRCGHLNLYRSSGLQYWHACIAKMHVDAGTSILIITGIIIITFSIVIIIIIIIIIIIFIIIIYLLRIRISFLSNTIIINP